jgi:DNA polymerase-3 subunit alpha
LKANYPVEFLAASMTLDTGNTDKLMQFRQEAQRMGISVVSPSVNASGVDFTVKDGTILYSLAALKNVGTGAIVSLVEARNEGGPFTSLADFARRVDAKAMNRRALESMIKSGAFDNIHSNRAQLFSAVDAMIGMSQRSQSATAAGQDDLFGGGGKTKAEELPMLPRDNWLPMERLGFEFEAVGFYLSGHPLDEYGKALRRLNVEKSADFLAKVRAKGMSAAKLAATVTQKQERRSKAGNRFAFVSFSDPTGQFETVCFSDTLMAARDLLEPGTSVIIRVEADVDGEDVKLRLQSVEALDMAVAGIVQGVQIFIRDQAPLQSISKRLQKGGKAPVLLTLLGENGHEVDVSLGQSFVMSPQIRAAIKATHGVVDVLEL